MCCSSDVYSQRVRTVSCVWLWKCVRREVYPKEFDRIFAVIVEFLGLRCREIPCFETTTLRLGPSLPQWPSPGKEKGKRRDTTRTRGKRSLTKERRLFSTKERRS